MVKKKQNQTIANKKGIEGTYLNIIKTICDKPYQQIQCNSY